MNLAKLIGGVLIGAAIASGCTGYAWFAIPGALFGAWCECRQCCFQKKCRKSVTSDFDGSATGRAK